MKKRPREFGSLKNIVFNVTKLLKRIMLDFFVMENDI